MTCTPPIPIEDLISMGITTLAFLFCLYVGLSSIIGKRGEPYLPEIGLLIAIVGLIPYVNIPLALLLLAVALLRWLARTAHRIYINHKDQQHG